MSSDDYKTCPKCNGDREISNISGPGFAPGTYNHHEEDQYEDGNGAYSSSDKQTCPKCGGSGNVPC